MSNSDYLLLGDYNVACFECGRKFKSSMMKVHWRGYLVCPQHWESRHPQDFASGAPEKATPPLTQLQYDNFIAPFPEPPPFDPNNP